LGGSDLEPLVGDGAAPADGGWLHGQPGSGVYRPYVVVVSRGASPQWNDLVDEGTWSVGFELRSFGGSRRQADLMAHMARLAVDGLVTGQSFGTPVGKVVGTQWVSLGAVVRVDATAPPTWQVFDTITLVCGS